MNNPEQKRIFLQDQVKEYCRNKTKTQKEIASIIGVTEQTLSRWLHFKMDMNIRKVDQLRRLIAQ